MTKRILRQSNQEFAWGVYDDPESQCIWEWDSESGEIIDLTLTASVVVGYANTLYDVLTNE